MDEFCCEGEGAGAGVCELPHTSGRKLEAVANDCPVCGERGKPVGTITVKSMLVPSLREIREGGYKFCRTRSCPVVYFSADGRQEFRIADVRDRVFQKEPEADDVRVCYCFNHRVGDVSRADEPGRQEILRDIKDGIGAGQCWCEVRNPQGSCCLGNVQALIKGRREGLPQHA
jgi:hypothetical protein